MMPKMPPPFAGLYTVDDMVKYGRAVAEACAHIAKESISSAFPVAAHVAIREAMKDIGK